MSDQPKRLREGWEDEARLRELVPQLQKEGTQGRVVNVDVLASLFAQIDELRAELSAVGRIAGARVGVSATAAARALAHDRNQCAHDRNDALDEVKRLSEAMQHIADGGISPSIDFARHVMDGKTRDEAHKAGKHGFDS